MDLDVHADTIAIEIAEPDGEVRSLGTIPNRTESIRKMIRTLGPAEKLRACYEAGPTGYVVYWQLADLGVQCEVVAPHTGPMKAGDRVGVRPWTRPYLIWVAQLCFAQIAQEATRQDYLHELEHMRERVAQGITEAVKLASPALQQVINDLQALRGIGDISAVTIAAELGQASRFDSTPGNAHLRRIVVTQSVPDTRWATIAPCSFGDASTPRSLATGILAGNSTAITQTTGEHLRRGERD